MFSSSTPALLVTNGILRPSRGTVVEIADDDCSLRYRRFVYVSHYQHCSYPSKVLSSSLPFALPPFSLPTYFLLIPLAPISLSFPPLLSSSFHHSLSPSLSPLHSFLSSLPLSLHFTLPLSGMSVSVDD